MTRKSKKQHRHQSGARSNRVYVLYKSEKKSLDILTFNKFYCKDILHMIMLFEYIPPNMPFERNLMYLLRI